MAIRIAINGFGRIGRTILRALYENDYRKHLQVVAINDLGNAETNAHLFKYDSVHGRLDGLAVRVPTINVSLIDFSFIAGKETSVDEINQAVRAAADNSQVLGYNTEKLVSIDFNHNALSGIFDANHTRVLGRHVKVMAWHDNEWGFSNRMLDSAIALLQASERSGSR